MSIATTSEICHRILTCPAAQSMTTYRIGEKIGSGGMANVYLAVQKGAGSFEKLVVFKRMLPWALDQKKDVDRFLREARIAAPMSHPNIVSTFDVGQDDQSPYIVMEYLRGESVSYILRTLRGTPKRIPVDCACKIASDVAAGLDYAHTMVLSDTGPSPIVHRDVSPSNIMCCFDGVSKLVDFGIAKIPAEDLTQEGVLKGKLSHIAPEQIEGAAADPRSDVFQLGIVLWEMLTMRRLFSGDNDAQRVFSVLNQTVANPSTHNPEVSGDLDAIVQWALERDPDHRCPSASALHNRLEQHLSQTHGAPPDVRGWLERAFPDRIQWRQDMERDIRSAEDPPAPPPPPNRSRRAGVGLGLVALAITAIAVIVGVATPLDPTSSGESVEPPPEVRTYEESAFVEPVNAEPAAAAPQEPEPEQEPTPPEDPVDPPSPDESVDPPSPEDPLDPASLEDPQDPPSPEDPVDPPPGEDPSWLRPIEEDDILDPFAPG